MSELPAAILGPMERRTAGAFEQDYFIERGDFRLTKFRPARCPFCGVALVIHLFDAGTLSKAGSGGHVASFAVPRLKVLRDGSWGAVTRGPVPNHDAVPPGLVAAFPIVVHCPTASCGDRRIRVDRPVVESP